MPRQSAQPQVPPTSHRREYELEFIEGIEGFAEQELEATLGSSVKVGGRPGLGRIAISYDGPPTLLNRLRSIVAAHLVETFNVPRPRALLGHSNLTRILEALREIMGQHPPGAFETFRISAAGADSSVFARLKQEIAGSLNLRHTDSGAQLLISVRRESGGRTGWQALVRTTPAPLSARAWRVCNLPGALNATVASVMAGLAGARAGERFVNLACGSGTLLIERLELGSTSLALGIDADANALDCARANLEASGHHEKARLVLGDAGRLPLPDASADTLVGDLPYGMLMGSREHLDSLYSAVLSEAARVAAPGATLALITASVRRFEAVMREHRDIWLCEQVIPLKIPFRSGYVRPRIYVLRKRG
ncbi:MAG: methyltransferase domain-containing protein [Chloroflexi bacterium]|nr:methyltransferase domain-containing protein [Chloroflexota bacterium]